MAFGLLVDIPALLIVLFLLAKFRVQLARLFLRIHLPRFLIFLLSSVPFLIYEEHINCMPEWCLKVVIPPTIPFLLVFMLLLGFFVERLKARNIFRIELVFSVLGIIYEVFLGASAGKWAGLSVPFLAFMVIWVGISYAFVALVPLTILLEPRKV